MSIIITGGCSGLGLGMAKKYSKAGARITICGRREEKVKKAQRIRLNQRLRRKIKIAIKRFKNEFSK